MLLSMLFMKIANKIYGSLPMVADFVKLIRIEKKYRHLQQRMVFPVIPFLKHWKMTMEDYGSLLQEDL
jgi:hypothetical protein